MTSYKWAHTFNQLAAGVSLNNEPDVDKFQDMLEEIAGDNEGNITPQKIVDRARPKNSPNHSVFEWNNKVAGEKYRLEQSKLAVRNVKAIYEDEQGEEKEIRAWTSIVDPDPDSKKRVYVDTFEAMNEKEIREQMLMQALQGLISWRKKWAEYAELAEACELVEQAQKAARLVIAGGR